MGINYTINIGGEKEKKKEANNTQIQIIAIINRLIHRYKLYA